MIPEHIGDAASRGDHDTIRAYFEDDSDGARDVKSLIADVRRAGSWKSYCRLPHKQVLRLRSLLVRGRAQGTLRTEPRIRWLLKLPNDPLWHVLSYWRATE